MYYLIWRFTIIKTNMYFYLSSSLNNNNYQYLVFNFISLDK